MTIYASLLQSLIECTTASKNSCFTDDSAEVLPDNWLFTSTRALLRAWAVPVVKAVPTCQLRVQTLFKLFLAQYKIACKVNNWKSLESQTASRWGKMVSSQPTQPHLSAWARVVEREAQPIPLRRVLDGLVTGVDRELYSASHTTGRWKLGPRHSCSVPVGSMFTESANMFANKSTLASSSLRQSARQNHQIGAWQKGIKENRKKETLPFMNVL